MWLRCPLRHLGSVSIDVIRNGGTLVRYPPLWTLGNTLLCAANIEIKSFVGFIGCCQGRLLQMRPAMCENLGHPEEMLTLGF